MPYRVVVIGAGFGGIGMAIALKRAGIDDFVVLDRAGDLGGTWRDNSYPGLACDVPSHLYSFSFRPWRWSYPPDRSAAGHLADAERREARELAHDVGHALQPGHVDRPDRVGIEHHDRGLHLGQAER